MRKGRLYGTCVLILAAGFAANCVFAEKQERTERKQQERAERKQTERKQTEGRQRGKADEARQAFHEEQKARREAHYEAQKQENEAFRAGVKDKTPAEKCAAIKQHRSKQYAENEAFHKEQHQRRLDFTKSRLAEKEVPQDKQNEMITKMGEHYQQMSERSRQRHEEHMALLDRLSAKSDLTHEELREAMKEFQQTRKKERSEFREQQRKGNRGKEK